MMVGRRHQPAHPQEQPRRIDQTVEADPDNSPDNMCRTSRSSDKAMSRQVPTTHDRNAQREHYRRLARQAEIWLPSQPAEHERHRGAE